MPRTDQELIMDSGGCGERDPRPPGVTAQIGRRKVIAGMAMAGLTAATGVATPASADPGQRNLRVRAMAFNIWRSGTLDGRPGGEQNLKEIIEFIRSEKPDIVFIVETHGSGDRITEGLNEGRPADDQYTGVQVTRRPDQAPNTDNLWLFTRFEVEHSYPAKTTDQVNSYHFGGARLRLPNDARVHAFPTWLRHLGPAKEWTHQTAVELAYGFDRTHTDEDLYSTDYSDRIPEAKVILGEWLPEYLQTDPKYADAPVLLGGDFNTLPALDWTDEFADAPGHHGLVLDWPATRMFADAGFVDTYRKANPDVARYPGRTWSPLVGWLYAPTRIDYVMARGKGVRVESSYVRKRRLPEHRGTELDHKFPFYSDHAAVITDLIIAGPKPAPVPDHPVGREEPERPVEWPEPPTGEPIPIAEITVTASSTQDGSDPEWAADGNFRTHWHSRYSPELDPEPHTLTLDLGSLRELSAVRYTPRTVGNLNGTFVYGVLESSRNGTDWTEVVAYEWERTVYPKDLVFEDGLAARYLRFRNDHGISEVASAGEIVPYLR